ncbi:TetR/AcrR family transcriptional regulator [Actinoplanes sp. CA-142083]|uniref:TetR/AcrR family transcriptional regulator n=1 Tax=Actinoplanes sp. CA-142083 TaxID=3239903 RepID=UPI003D8FB2EA
MRRLELLDAAIAVLGESGMHGLTHRRVDTAAGAPAGTTSNHFRTRDALLNAVVVRFAERERANAEAIAGRLRPTSPAELAAALVEMAHAATGEHRELTLARYAILVEAGTAPGLRAQLLETGAGVNDWFMAWLRLAGSADPPRDAPIIMNHWTGVVLHELAVPDPAFDPTAQITTLVTTVLGAGVRA